VSTPGRSSSQAVFRKERRDVPSGYFEWEAAGLRWLAAVEQDGGAAVVPVIAVGEHHVDLRRLTPTAPTAGAARELGVRLARTHAAGAEAYGAGPPGWDGDGFFGPLEQPLRMVLGRWHTWGRFFGEARVAPLVRAARDAGLYDGHATRTFDRVVERLTAGTFDTDDRPARLHGDLWSGNVMWTAGGAVLIDPAAHGGHRETDLALLALFGAPHLDEVRQGYEEVRRLAEGWRERVALHQLHCLLVHALVFGGGYVARALGAATACS
jgi:fructosamine-3-kinase